MDYGNGLDQSRFEKQRKKTKYYLGATNVNEVCVLFNFLFFRNLKQKHNEKKQKKNKIYTQTAKEKNKGKGAFFHYRLE